MTLSQCKSDVPALPAELGKLVHEDDGQQQPAQTDLHGMQSQGSQLGPLQPVGEAGSHAPLDMNQVSLVLLL